MLRDKKMKFMMFATGNIYKTTGTTSNDIESPSFKQRKLGDIELELKSKLFPNDFAFLDNVAWPVPY